MQDTPQDSGATTPPEPLTPAPALATSPTAETTTPAATPTTEMAPMPAPLAEPPKKKSKSIVIGIIIAVLAVAVIVGVVFLILNLANQGENSSKSEHAIIKPVEEKYTSYEKIALEYQSGGIDINEYFKQLVNLEFHGSEVDEMYASDYDAPSGFSSASEIIEIINDNYDKLDKSVVEDFLYNYTQASYYFGTEEDNKVGASSDVKLAKDNSSKTVKQHFFTEVKASKNNNFLIWYTKEGSDKITDAQANAIANSLENAASKYSEYFGVKYRLATMHNDLFAPSRIDKAEKMLKEHGLDAKIWKNAMSVYVYDTGSEDVLAYWAPLPNGLFYKLIVDFADFEVTNWPYVVINQSLIDDTNNSATGLDQVSNHELFHHYTYLYCLDAIGKNCDLDFKDGFYYGEMSANFAASRISGTWQDSFLSAWTGRFSERIDGGIMNVYKPGKSDSTTGYGVYPYLISYIEEANGSPQTILAAHTKTDPLGYIESASSSKQMHTAIAKAAGYALTGALPDGYAGSTDGTTKKPTINEYVATGLTNESLEPGAIVFYIVDQGTEIRADSDNPLMTYVILDEQGTELWRSDEQPTDISGKEPCKNKETCYLAYANGSLTTSATIKINVKQLSDRKPFATSYRNYKLDIAMSLTMSGITVKSKATGVMDELHQLEHIYMTSTTAGIDVENEIYTDFYGQKSYTSSPNLGLGGLGALIGEDAMPAWTVDDHPKYFVDLGQIIKKIEEGGDKVTKIDDSHYKLRMSAADVQDLMASNGESASSVELPEREIESTVTIENGYIAQIEYDFGDFAGIDEFTATVKFSDYNKAGSVYIPLTIKKQAK